MRNTDNDHFCINGVWNAASSICNCFPGFVLSSEEHICIPATQSTTQPVTVTVINDRCTLPCVNGHCHKLLGSESCVCNAGWSGKKLIFFLSIITCFRWFMPELYPHAPIYYSNHQNTDLHASLPKRKLPNCARWSVLWLWPGFRRSIVPKGLFFGYFGYDFSV